MSHVPKKKKAVLLVSSSHHSIERDLENGLPEIVSFYNRTKGGVDSLDMKCSNYCSNRRIRRWPMAVFYRIVDISAINAYLLFLHYKGITPKSRFAFTKELSIALAKLLMESSLQNPRLNREIHGLTNNLFWMCSDTSFIRYHKKIKRQSRGVKIRN
ncbi:hypothetical protein NQ314_013995 [Rhamnusium bicolor]|uniref:PiggyBac transposable element-derived protein domain-containing protein n=1 Tax=Rhamnusium bicolor TaxID=1586634 RepID=A0AAV8X478_9CUCU|nr:hypothetical protein NQ314_013995 [Rhamnusium bicolor]